MEKPLPFDDIEKPKNLLGRIEERKLMSYQRLDNAGVHAGKVRYCFEDLSNEYPSMSDWDRWQYAVTEVTGKSWEEIAPIIYEGLV